MHPGSLSVFLASLATASVATAASTPDLGAAGSFGVLSSTFTRNSGVTAITGDAGYTTLDGSGSDTVSGFTYTPSPPAADAGQTAALTALNGEGCTFPFATGAVNLATDTTHGPVGVYTPGVYCGDAAMNVGTLSGGTITLNGKGTYIFRCAGAFNTPANSKVILTGGAKAADVFWLPGGLTTLGANSAFVGTVIDDIGITVGSTVAWSGRAMAFNGTVTTDTDTIAIPVSFSLVKKQIPASPAFGGPLSYQLIVTNTGYGTIQNMIVVDTVSPLLTLITTDQPAGFGAPVATSVSGAGTLYVWSGSALVFGPARSFTITITGTIGAIGSPAMVSNTFFAYSGDVAENSNVVAFTLDTILSISIVSATTYDFQSVARSSVTVSATTFDILNDGNIPATLELAVTDPSPWTSTNSGAPSGWNHYELDAQFNFPGQPGIGTWDPGVHALPTASDVSTAARFAGNENGVGVPAGDLRHLWTRFLAPSLTDQTDVKRMNITITAQP